MENLTTVTAQINEVKAELATLMAETAVSGWYGKGGTRDRVNAAKERLAELEAKAAEAQAAPDPSIIDVTGQEYPIPVEVTPATPIAQDETDLLAACLQMQAQVLRANIAKLEAMPDLKGLTIVRIGNFNYYSKEYTPGKGWLTCDFGKIATLPEEEALLFYRKCIKEFHGTGNIVSIDTAMHFKGRTIAEDKRHLIDIEEQIKELSLKIN